MGRDNAVNVHTTRKQIYLLSIWKHINIKIVLNMIYSDKLEFFSYSSSVAYRHL